MKKMLIVDDDAHISNLVKVYAELDGFECSEAGDADQALKFVSESDYDILILDIMMPGRDGYATLAEIRKYSQVPVIMLTARSEEYDKLMGFSLGADDYVSKPFSPKVLLAKANALLRRSSVLPADTVNAVCGGNISILPSAHKVFLEGQEITLTYKEYELLSFLMSNPGQIFSREQLLNRIWGYEFEGTTRTVDTHIKTLRKKLGGEGRHIVTLIRSGYKFEVTI
mgnify:CR=1 FL=1